MFYYSVTLTHKLTTDLGSLELQRCTQPLPPQQHPLCLWKHQGFGYGRQIKCISQTRTQLQAMWQTERARKSRAKKNPNTRQKRRQPDPTTARFHLPRPLAFHRPFCRAFASSEEDTSRQNSCKHPAILPRQGSGGQLSHTRAQVLSRRGSPAAGAGRSGAAAAGTGAIWGGAGPGSASAPAGAAAPAASR